MSNRHSNMWNKKERAFSCLFDAKMTELFNIKSEIFTVQNAGILSLSQTAKGGDLCYYL